MNTALQSLIDRYQPSTSREWENALREIVQELAMLGLWRSKFYEHAAFCGGTALRMFHGLPRFSEDLDFSLREPWPEFDFKPHLLAVRAELTAFGFSFEVDPRIKRVETAIESAFPKGETRCNLLQIGAPESLRSHFPASKQLSIRLEIDTEPPAGAEDEVRTQLVPIPYQVRLYDLPCLFAGKLHAMLCRNWKSRVKGRDFYDFVWYLGRDTPVHLSHLRQRMEQTGHWEPSAPLDLAQLKDLLLRRSEAVDFAQAKEDVRPFVRDPDELALWSREFFAGLTDRIRMK